MARPSNSWVWEFYGRKLNTNLESGSWYVECKFCHKIMKYTSRNGPTNLSKHLIKIHQIDQMGYIFHKKYTNDNTEKIDEPDDEHHLSSIINDLAGNHNISMNFEATNVFDITHSENKIRKDTNTLQMTNDNNTGYEVVTTFIDNSTKSAHNEPNSNTSVEDEEPSFTTNNFKADVNLLPIYRLKVPNNGFKRKGTLRKANQKGQIRLKGDTYTKSRDLISILNSHELMLKDILSTKKEQNSSEKQSEQETIVELNGTVNKMHTLITSLIQDIKKHASPSSVEE